LYLTGTKNINGLLQAIEAAVSSRCYAACQSQIIVALCVREKYFDLSRVAIGER
jgi:hypothetical protein